MDWICDCGYGKEEALVILKDFLNIFEQTDATGNPYLSIGACTRFCEQYGYGVYHLLFCCLEKMRYCGHHGAVNSSGYLTPSGAELREQVLHETKH